jgi:hypothetical protein
LRHCAFFGADLFIMIGVKRRRDMGASRFSWTAVMGLLIAVAPAVAPRAEQLKPAEPPAQLQQAVPATPEPVNSETGANATTTPGTQLPGPVAPRPVTSQSTPATELAPARK